MEFCSKNHSDKVPGWIASREYSSKAEKNMASSDEQSSGLLSWRAARQPEMNEQICAGIVQSQWMGFVAIDVCFEEHEQ